MLSRAEKIEYAELLQYMALGDFEKRRSRMRAAEERLGMWKDGKFTGTGIGEILQKAGFYPETLTRDEFIVSHLGFFPENAAQQMQKIRDKYEKKKASDGQ